MLLLALLADVLHGAWMNDVQRVELDFEKGVLRVVRSNGEFADRLFEDGEALEIKENLSDIADLARVSFSQSLDFRLVIRAK